MNRVSDEQSRKWNVWRVKPAKLKLIYMKNGLKWKCVPNSTLNDILKIMSLGNEFKQMKSNCKWRCLKSAVTSGQYIKSIWYNSSLFFVWNLPSFVKHKLMSIIMKCNVGLHKGRFEWIEESDTWWIFKISNKHNELLSQCSSFNDDNCWHKIHTKQHRNANYMLMLCLNDFLYSRFLWEL